MALYNELHAQRFARLFQKVFGIKGAPPVRQVGTEISPVYSVDIDAADMYLAGWNRFWSSISQAAVAAQFSQFKLLNPLKSGIICVVEQCSVGVGGTADTFRFQVSNDAAFTTPGNLANTNANSSVLDRRSRGAGIQPNCTISSGTTAAAPTPSYQIQSPAGSANAELHLIHHKRQEVTILPGDSLIVTGTTVNQNALISFQFRERPLEDSEIT